MPDQSEIQSDVDKLRKIEIDARKQQRHARDKKMANIHRTIAHEAGQLADKIEELLSPNR